MNAASLTKFTANIQIGNPYTILHGMHQMWPRNRFQIENLRIVSGVYKNQTTRTRQMSQMRKSSGDDWTQCLQGVSALYQKLHKEESPTRENEGPMRKVPVVVARKGWILFAVHCLEKQLSVDAKAGLFQRLWRSALHLLWRGNPRLSYHRASKSRRSRDAKEIKNWSRAGHLSLVEDTRLPSESWTGSFMLELPIGEVSQ